MSTDLKRIHKELTRLIKNLDSTFAGQVILDDDSVGELFDDSSVTLRFSIKPTDGLYKDFRVGFEVDLDGYPSVSPDIDVTSDFYMIHPNISAVDGVCVNVFDEWDTSKFAIAPLIKLIFRHFETSIVTKKNFIYSS